MFAPLDSHSDGMNPEDSAYLDAIHEYETACDRGVQIDPETFLQRFPSLQERLTEFLRRRGALCGIVGGKSPPEFVTLQDFSHYRIGKIVDWGGNASIHEVEDCRFGRIQALKVPLKVTVRDEKAMRRLEEEAQLSGRLQHPHILPIYDVGYTETTDGNLPYFTMPLVNGRSLAKVLADSTDRAADRFEFLLLFQQVCQAVGYAHRQGIVHRDLKPGNVMVGEYRDAYVADWGYARDLNSPRADRVFTPGDFERLRNASPSGHADPEATLILQTESDLLAPTEGVEFFCTPAYMAPEVALHGSPVADQRSDVFGLGGILCAILTGTPTFLGDSSTATYLSRIGSLDDTYERLDRCGAADDLVELAKNCLAVDPQARPADASAVARRVTEYIERQERAKLEAERQTAIAAQARAEAEHAARREAERTAAAERRAKRLTVGLATSLVALTVIGAIGLRQSYESARRQHESEITQNVQQLRRRATELRTDARAIPLDSRAALETAIAVMNRSASVLIEAQASAKSAQVTGPLIDELQAELDAHQRETAERQRWAAFISGLHRAAERTTAVVDKYAPSGEMVKTALVEAFANFGIELGEGQETAIADTIRVMPSPLCSLASSYLDTCALMLQNRAGIPNLMAISNKVIGSNAEWRVAFENGNALNPRETYQTLQQLEENATGTMLLWTYLLAQSDDRGLAVEIASTARTKFRNSFFIHMAASEAYAGVSDYQMATECMRSALAIAPESPTALTSIGKYCRKTGHSQEAESWLNEALRIEPDHPWALCNLGLKRLTVDGNTRSARELFRRALELNSTYSLAADGLALSFLLEGNTAKAESIHASLGIDSTDSFNNKLMESMRLFSAYKFEQAAAIWIRLEDHPLFEGDRNARLLSGFGLLLEGRFEEAKEVFMSLRSQNFTAHTRANAACGIAVLQLIEGHFIEAEASARDALSIMPEAYVAKTLVAAALGVQGRLVEARALVNELRTDNEGRAPGVFGGLLYAFYGRIFSFAMNPSEHVLEAETFEGVRENFNLGLTPFFAGPIAELALARRRTYIAAQIYSELIPPGSFNNFMVSRINGAMTLFSGFPSNRLNATRAVALKLSGVDVDNISTSDEKAARFEEMARQWFRAEINEFRRRSRLKKDPLYVKIWLHFVRNCPDLALFREDALRSKLPEDKQVLWRELWADVDQLAIEVHSKVPEPSTMPATAKPR